MSSEQMIREAAEEFAGTFGLRSFPGKSGFYVDESQSYVSNGEVHLYVYDETGMAFAKATPDELRRLVVGRIPEEV